MSDDGWVSNEGYEDAVRKERLKREMEMDGNGDDIPLLERGWPFRDRDEVD